MWQRIICKRASAPKAEDGVGALDKPRARGPSVPAPTSRTIGAVAAASAIEQCEDHQCRCNHAQQDN